LACASTILRDGAGLVSMASRATTPSIDQHQISGRSRAGHARGARYVQVLVADYQPQDWMASRHAGLLRDVLTTSLLNWRGLRSASFSRIQIGGILPRRNSRVRAVTGCASHFHSANPAGANRLCVRNTLPNQHVLQTVADRFHVTRRLSRASLRPTHIGRSEKVWRYLISVMRCPK
jgi:hypothetical protein